MKIYQHLHSKIFVFIFIASALLFIELNFGAIDSFMFQHMGLMKKYDFDGYIVDREPILGNSFLGVSGFYAFGIIISQISNISYDILFFLPIQLIPIFLLFFLIFKNTNDNLLLISLIFLILATFAWNTYFTFSVHGLGFTLFLSVILSTVILFRSNNLNTHVSSFLIICISILSINYVSYKSTMYVLSFILMCLSIEFFKFYVKKSNQNMRQTFLNIFLIGIIITLSFNSFIYKTFIPSWRIRDEGWFNEGIQKFIILFDKDSHDLLSYYELYYSPPSLLAFTIGLRQILLGLITLICIIKLLTDISKKDRDFIDISSILILSFFFVAIINISIYNLLGSFDVGILSYVGFMALLFIQKKYGMKKLIYFSIIVLLILNVTYNMTVIESNIATKDKNYFEYIKPSVRWYMNYGTENLRFRTDVLTKGYFIKEMVNKNITLYPTHFNEDDIIFIDQKYILKELNKNTIYGLNFKEEHFSITNWRILKSFRYFKGNIDSNQNLNKIYTSSNENVVIYSVK